MPLKSKKSIHVDFIKFLGAKKCTGTSLRLHLYFDNSITPNTISVFIWVSSSHEYSHNECWISQISPFDHCLLDLGRLTWHWSCNLQMIWNSLVRWCMYIHLKSFCLAVICLKLEVAFLISMYLLSWFCSEQNESFYELKMIKLRGFIANCATCPSYLDFNSLHLPQNFCWLNSLSAWATICLITNVCFWTYVLITFWTDALRLELWTAKNLSVQV